MPVVSTPIRDVIRPYGMEGLVSIASDARGFIAAVEQCHKENNKDQWLQKADEFLKNKSWEDTFRQMTEKMIQTMLDIEKRLAS